jgi:putative NADH-flavin reductase
MKILVLGATGKIGNELTQRALERGAEVTALVRTPAKLRTQHQRLDIIVGSPTDAQLLARIAQGKDAVVSTLGHTDLKASSLVTDAAGASIRAMTESGVRRLVIVSSTLVAPGGGFLAAIPRHVTRHALRDSAEMENVVRATSLDWTILRLSRLTNGAASRYRLFENEPPSVTASVSRKTVAVCVLDILADARSFRQPLGLCALPGRHAVNEPA